MRAKDSDSSMPAAAVDAARRAAAAGGTTTSHPARDLYIQALRGLAIAAVVLIHVLPGNAIAVAIRPFLNFCVALFVFLSGYLTPAAKCADVRGFYGRRVGKILWPYLLWSLFYLAASQRLQPLVVAKNLLIGGGLPSCTTSSSTCSWCCSPRCCIAGSRAGVRPGLPCGA